MRRARLKAPEHHNKAYYHCISRVVDRQFVLQETEKEEFVRLMRIYEKLYGLKVMTFCIMSNHFHILLEVPQRPASPLPDVELVELIRDCLGDKEAELLEKQITRHLSEGEPDKLHK